MRTALEGRGRCRRSYGCPLVHKVARAGLVLAALAGFGIGASACGGSGGSGGHTTTTKAPGY